MYSSAPLLVALATFSAYTALGETLDVATALTALALFDIIRFPMIMLPQVVNSIVEAGISVERIREFLLSEEYSVVGEGSLKESGEVWMNNGTFVYGKCALERVCVKCFFFSLLISVFYANETWH
jgi:ATP-binding cassette subfamily C (CFTR/MRP) protein 1